MHPLWNVLYLVGVATVVTLFELKLVMGGDAIFLVGALLAVFSGHLMVATSEEQPARAPARRSTTQSVLAYVACLALAGVIAVQTLAVI